MFKSFEEFLASSSSEISTSNFIFDILLTALLTALISKVYQYYGTSLSNRKLFSKNFILIATTTMLIITVVKSSLALSLGLVGALSIIRFRTAVKEPEELAYLFLIIAIGLGFGANQTKTTLIAYIFICCVLIFKQKFSNKYNDSNSNLILVMSGVKLLENDFEKILETLHKNCKLISLKRLEESTNEFEASFIIEPINFKSLQIIKDSLSSLVKLEKVSFLDNNIL